MGIRTLLQAGKVRRYHTIPTLKEQTVADHSWGVALLVAHVTEDVPVESRIRMIEYALTHDLHELVTGDIPATAKWNISGLESALFEAEREFESRHQLHRPNTLNAHELQIVKWCDMFELVIHTERERLMGNSLIREVYENGRSWLSRNSAPTLKAAELLSEFFG